MSAFRRWAPGALSLAISVFVLAAVFAGAGEAKTKIVYWTIGTGLQTYRSAQEGLEEAFEKAHPDIDVDVQYITDAIETKLQVALASDIAPDVVTLSTRTAPAFQAQGYLAPIDFAAIGVKDEQSFLKLFVPGMQGILRSIGNDYYWFPAEISVFGLFYNEEMLMNAGLDKPGATWQKLAAESKKFIQKDPSGAWTRWGLTIPRTWIWPYFTFLTFARQAGGDWVTPDGKPGFSDPKVREAMQYYQDLYLRLQVLDPTPGRDFGAIFASGKAAYHAGVSYMIADWKRQQAPFTVKSAANPYLEGGRRSTVAYGYGNFVLASSKHQKEAWQVAKFFTIDHASQWFTKAQIFCPGAGPWLTEVVKQEPNLVPFLQEFQYARLEIVHPKYTDIRSAIVNADKDLVAGKSVSEVLATLDDKLRTILAASATSGQQK
ncbi:MAG TPA: extracellular solute-binding protein [Firmicutes bacterium]|nr:extracellular solute-binding protein [Bacillota bacterium]